MRQVSSRIAVPLFAALIFILASAAAARGQLIIGQYEDEAPLSSWNVFGTIPAGGLGLGGIRLARAWDASTAAANPALLTTLPRLSLSLTGTYAVAQLYRFSAVNTGVLASESNFTTGTLALESGGLSLRFGNWAAGFTAGLLESYGRPLIDQDYSVQGTVLYALRLKQTGYLRGCSVALARRLGGHLSLGAGINLVTGSLDRALIEEWPVDGVTISDVRRERFNAFYVNAGFHLAVSDRVSVSLALRTPYKRKSDADSTLRYTAAGGATDILIEAAARNSIHQPLIIGSGLDVRWSEDWSAVAEIIYFGWSRYKVIYFDEPLPRSYRDIVAAAAGIEYALKGRLGARPARFPIRLGLAYDPQPMEDVRSSYLSLAFGLGLRWGSLAADIGGRVGRERGSGNSLKAGRIALSLSWLSDDR